MAQEGGFNKDSNTVSICTGCLLQSVWRDWTQYGLYTVSICTGCLCYSLISINTTAKTSTVI
jgi:hypothetical protein